MKLSHLIFKQQFSTIEILLVIQKLMSYYNTIGLQVNVSPKVDFVEDNNGELIPPKIQGVRVIVDAMKGIFIDRLCSNLK